MIRTYSYFVVSLAVSITFACCKTPQKTETTDTTEVSTTAPPPVVPFDPNCDEDVYAPVIGSDGLAYLNACRAGKAGVSVLSEGYNKQFYDLLNTATWPIESVCKPIQESWDTLAPQDLGDGTFLYVNKEGITFRGSRNQCRCLSASTLIDCPQGQIPVSELHIGDSIYSAGINNERIATVVRDINKVRVEPTHQVIELHLADGRFLRVSPGHPAAENYLALEHFAVGDTLDGSPVVSKIYTQLGDTCTYDILPKSWMGDYWANGILIGSTMRYKYYTEDLLELGW